MEKLTFPQTGPLAAEFSETARARPVSLQAALLQ